MTAWVYMATAPAADLLVPLQVSPCKESLTQKAVSSLPFNLSHAKSHAKNLHVILVSV